MPQSGITGSYGNSIFKETSLLFSIVAAPAYIPTNSVGGFLSIFTPTSCWWVFKSMPIFYKISFQILLIFVYKKNIIQCSFFQFLQIILRQTNLCMSPWAHLPNTSLCKMC